MLVSLRRQCEGYEPWRAANVLNVRDLRVQKRLDIYWLNISGGSIIGCPNILRLLRLRHSSYQPAYSGCRTVKRKLGASEQTTQTRTKICAFRLIYVRKIYRVARKIWTSESLYAWKSWDLAQPVNLVSEARVPADPDKKTQKKPYPIDTFPRLTAYLQ